MAGSRWVKLDVQYLDNPKISALSQGAVVLHIAMIAYCAAELTDGFVPRSARATLAARASLGTRAARTAHAQLHAQGLLHESDDPENPGCWLHGFLDMNPQAERAVVEAERKSARERQARHRAKRVTP